MRKLSTAPAPPSGSTWLTALSYASSSSLSDVDEIVQSYSPDSVIPSMLPAAPIATMTMMTTKQQLDMSAGRRTISRVAR